MAMLAVGHVALSSSYSRRGQQFRFSKISQKLKDRFPIACTGRRGRLTCPSAADGGDGEGSAPDPSALDFNQLHTALNAAIAADDFELAAQIRDVIAAAAGHDPSLPSDWGRLGVLDWLVERAEDLGFRIPTEIQRRAATVIADGCDCVLESETGSGKTLAFLLPALSLLPYPPLTYPDDLAGPPLLVVVPTRELGVQVVMLTYKLFGGSVNPGIPGERANMFRYQGPRGLKVRGLLLPEEVDSAVSMRYLAGVHVVVGTPALIAHAMVRNTWDADYLAWACGVRASFDCSQRSNVGSIQILVFCKMMSLFLQERGVEVAQHCRVLVVDESDACFAEAPDPMRLIVGAAISGFSTNAPTTSQASTSDTGDKPRQRPSVVLVGATIEESLVEEAVKDGWLQDPVRVAVGARMRAPAGLQHRYIVTEPNGRLGAMFRQLRQDLKQQSPDAAPARVIIFADSEAQARVLADPLRTVLWGEHSLSVLLPEGVEPIKALHSFRDNKTTLLLATPNAARGLDLPAVSHVYNVSPPKDAAEYLHRAGRAGRIGSPVSGIVTTMTTEQELPQLLALGEALGLTLRRAEAPPAHVWTAPDGGDGDAELGDVDEARRALEAALALSPRDDDENQTQQEY